MRVLPDIIYSDLYRIDGKKDFRSLLSFAFRKIDFRWILIGWHTRIGERLRLVYCGDIAMNNDVTVGKNCTMYQGITIGMKFRGEMRGNSTIGDNVWIGSDACISARLR